MVLIADASQSVGREPFGLRKWPSCTHRTSSGGKVTCKAGFGGRLDAREAGEGASFGARSGGSASLASVGATRPRVIPLDGKRRVRAGAQFGPVGRVSTGVRASIGQFELVAALALPPPKVVRHQASATRQRTFSMINPN